jgi:alpha-mannosidase
MDKLIEVLENDDGFKSFHLDGQIIVLDDYLAVRPSMRKRVDALIQKGKLKIGPFYILQDDYLLSGEANVRNALVGLKETEKYGKPTMVGYFPDTFGNIGQMPQILRGFDIDNAFMGRGTVVSSPDKLGSSEEFFSEFKWVSPDGSEVTTEQFILWYANGMELPEDKEALKGRLNALENAMAHCTKTPCILLMNGCDHQPVQANLAKVIENAKELHNDYVNMIGKDKDTIVSSYMNTRDFMNYSPRTDYPYSIHENTVGAKYILRTVYGFENLIYASMGYNYDITALETAMLAMGDNIAAKTVLYFLYRDGFYNVLIHDRQVAIKAPSLKAEEKYAAFMEKNAEFVKAYALDEMKCDEIEERCEDFGEDILF